MSTADPDICGSAELCIPSWRAVSAPGHVEALTIDPDTPTTLYAGGHGVFRSLNGGSNWQATGR